MTRQATARAKFRARAPAGSWIAGRAIAALTIGKPPSQVRRTGQMFAVIDYGCLPTGRLSGSGPLRSGALPDDPDGARPTARRYGASHTEGKSERGPAAT